MTRWLERLDYYERQGFCEVVGGENNPVIIKWAHGVGKANYMRDDSKTPWCGIGLAGIMDECGLGHIIPPGPAAAISWLACGVECEPKVGAIAVFEREGGHHVTVIKEIHGDRWLCTGCNQRDGICTLEYDGSTALGTRWPIAEKSAAELARQSRIAAAARRQERDGVKSAVSGGSGPVAKQMAGPEAPEAPAAAIGPGDVVMPAPLNVPPEMVPGPITGPSPTEIPLRTAVDTALGDLAWFKQVLGALMEFATFVGLKWPYIAAALSAYFFLRMWWDGVRIKGWRLSDHNEGYTT